MEGWRHLVTVIRAARFPLAFVAAGLAGAAGCGSGKLQDKDAAGIGGDPGIIVSGTAGAAGGGNTAGSGPPPPPCLDSDPRLVVAPQRTFVLTSTELVNMIRALVDDTEASAIVSQAVYPVITDLARRFPPAVTEQYTQIVDATSMAPFTNVARHVADYVFDNFAALTRCMPAQDACAAAYLAAFAEKAYRRPLDAQEQSDLDARYQAARGAGTVEEATRAVVAAILVAPPFLYRSEMGDPSRPSVSPPGLPLTPYELASALSFFLTDQPPDQALLDDARAGTLSPDTLPAHVDRLLATQAARDWLGKVMEAYFLLNQLPAVIIDSGKFPVADDSLYADLQTASRHFLDFTLWNLTLPELLTSRTAFLNVNLARTIYSDPAPVGATTTTFAQTTLPSDRAGILTDPGFLTTLSRSTGEDFVVRGEIVNSLLLCRPTPAPDGTSFASVSDGERRAIGLMQSQTVQEQVAYRASMPACASCHAHFDPYGLALEGYDVVGRLRATDDRGLPVDTHATLPPELGSVSVTGAAELARAVADSPVFTHCMATNMLRYAMVDARLPLLYEDLDGTPTCAAQDVVRRFDAGGAKTFPALLRAVALSPAFSLRAAP